MPSARPYAYRFRIESTALVIIDMQRDFLDAGGYGELQCNNREKFDAVRGIVRHTQDALQAARQLGLHVIHTREGHRPDLNDLPPTKRLRQKNAPSGQHTLVIGDQGPMGRLLVRGEYGHDIIDDLQPLPGELVVDKPGKGSFWNTSLHRSLLARGITHLLLAGVTTECCVNMTFREASDRGFECCLLTDCTSGFGEAFVTTTVEMLCSYDGLFGYVCPSKDLLQHVPAAQLTPPTTPPSFTGNLSLLALRHTYKHRQATVSEVAKHVLRRIAEYQAKDPAVWLHLQSSDEILESAKELEDRYRHRPLPPLYGVPFAVKDNIDVEGVPTTNACEKTSYIPSKSAKVVRTLLQAGALLIGKTNMDQLATGLSGCRSPLGYPRSAYDADRISGGSSSGSAVAVAAKLVTFALGTDTAGSGRVPAAFNGIVGFKPTKGTLSAEGLVPACKSMDTISIFSTSVDEARDVWLAVDEGPDMADPYAKTQQSLPLWHVDFRGVREGCFIFGVPPADVLRACSPEYQKHFQGAIERMRQVGGSPRDIDWRPFKGGSDLLYAGALLSERVHCSNPEFLQQHMEDLHPTLQELFRTALARDLKPWDVYRDQHLQAQYTREAALIFEGIDVLLLPTTTCHPTVAEMEADPIALNSELGEFTHFANVLDLCVLALPASQYTDSKGQELPFGVSLIGASGRDGKVFDIAREFERAA